MNKTKSEAFENDDYSELNVKFFKVLRENADMVADPSGWTDTFSNVANIYPAFHKSLQGYTIDLYNQLTEKKNCLKDLLSEWDSCSYSNDNITLCHSTTVGSAIVLAFLISKGIKKIITETPNYFATYYQAETMSINIIRVPTYYDSNFILNIEEKLIEQTSPCAVWLTQPRTALGFNQDPSNVMKILNLLTEKDFLVIDEATEQFFPSILSSLNPEKFPKVIKIRSMFKGLGINGIRLAFILHHTSFRPAISGEMEIFLGALDVHSLNHAVELAKDISKFRLLLSVANQQVISLREKAGKQIKGTNCELSRIENGYIGSLMLRFRKNNHDHTYYRTKFIEYCAREKVPVILGAAMGFPRHEYMEFVRLNYFNRDYNILEGVKIISGFSA